MMSTRPEQPMCRAANDGVCAVSAHPKSWQNSTNVARPNAPMLTFGMDDRPRATRDTIHRITPMPATRARVEHVERVFTPEERKTLELGLVPKSMDDHWLVFFEDGWLHCHRSWSG